MKKYLFIYLLIPILFSSCGNSWIPLSVDETLGSQSAAQINEGLSGMVILEEADYPEAYQYLNALKDKILASGKVQHASDFKWELKIIEDDSVLNAFCLPGGYIYVYTGLMKYLDSEDALAGVLGHEMAHADLRHGTSQLVKNMGLSLALQLIFGGDASQLVNIGANLISLSFSRGDETEADMQSVEYLYHTELDARGTGVFFDKLQKEGKDPEIVEFLSTHPNPDNRVEEIHKKWQTLGGKTGKRNADAYKRMLSTLND
jgi:beta-barrel assembly-enhancing protease